MNEQTNRNLTLIERIRDTCAEFDPVPDDVLAAARGALTTIRQQFVHAVGLCDFSGRC
jgi:hypothetical protein